MKDRRILAGGKEIWVIKAGYPNNSIKKCWSEYVFSNSLKKYLERLGYYVVMESLDECNDEEADVVVLLRGHIAYYPDRSNKDCIYIMWNLSHPDTITDEEYNAYDLVCIGSEQYAAELKDRINTSVRVLPMCADTEIFYPDTDPYGEKEYDWIFVGNSRYVKRKSVIWSIDNQIPLKIWGKNWDKVLPNYNDYVVAENIPNDDLPELYRNAKVTVDDHYEDMLKYGFINTRIVEAFACGLPVISDYSEVLINMFGDAILCYHNEKEFVEQTKYIIENYNMIKEKVLALWPMIKEKYSFEANAGKLAEFSREIKENRIWHEELAKDGESLHIKVSVIIPAYNAEKYLSECLESILNQTLKEIEVICIDDGSKDKTLSILGAFKQKDNRIHIFRQNHEGAGAARNLGLSKARGEYVVFLDADDIFREDMLEKIAVRGKETSADVIVFGAKRYDNRTGKIIDTPWYLRREMIPDKKVFSRKDMDGQIMMFTNPAPWTKAFRREFVINEKICFQNLPNSNDVYFVLVALSVAEKVTAIKEDFLFYRVFREGSLQNQKYNNPFCFLEAYEAVYDELNRRGIYAEVEKGFVNTVLSGCTYNLNSVNNEEARWKIIHALCSEKFTRMNILGFPEEYYHVLENRNKIAGLPYAVEVHDKFVKNEAYEPEILVKKSSFDKDKKVSVIIPVYNTRQYLKECMDSIVGQTLHEIEIICIDDGSTDRSMEILDNYAKTDDRVIIYQQKNCGLSVVRNRGLRHASGEYIYFMDSDDILRQDALENLYKRSKEKELDVLYFNAITMYENEEIRESHPEFDNYYVRRGDYPISCSGIEMFRQMKSAGEYRVNVGIQFFRREFLEEEGLIFQPGIIHEDNDFTFQAMLLAKRAGYIGETYFNRRIRKQSIMTAKVRFDHIYGYFKSFINMLSFLEGHVFPEEMTELLYDTVYRVLNNAKKGYSELSGAEKYASMGLKGSERIQFRIFIEQDDETVAKLHRTYAEKSEINRKLQITYGEKYDRGLEIKRLKKEIASIKKSRSYKLARIIGFPVRLFRRILNKGQK